MTNPFDFFTKETPPVADATTPTPGGFEPVAPAGEDAPVQEALDKIVDVWIASYARRPVIHMGLVGLRGMVDMTAPMVRSALAAAGLKIVRA